MVLSTATFALIVFVTAGGVDDIVLFDGRSLDGWAAEGVSEFSRDGQTLPVWSVRDGTLVCSGKGFGFLRYDRRQFTDFAFHVEFRMAAGCNSGLGIRTRPFDPTRSRATRPSFFGYEIQLFDDEGKPPTTHSSGSLYRYVAPRKNAMRRAGEWNTVDVTCDGPRIKVMLNGESIIDVDQSAVPELRQKPLSGYLCLQNHGGNIEFRSLRVRDLTRTEHRPAARAPGGRLLQPGSARTP